MRLNLGCGRAQFPTTRDNPFTAHQLGYLENHLPSALDPDADWRNVDAAPIDGVHVVMDLFSYPWKGADNSVDEIFCSHIIEHIPHEARLDIDLHYGVAQREALTRAAKLDGWYAFFYECWRVLKPDGVIHIVAPYAWSSAAILDPTHTRMVAPGSFTYFSPNPNAPFDYQIPARFEMTSIEYRPTPLGEQLVAQFGNEGGVTLAMRTIDALSEFYIGLRAVK